MVFASRNFRSPGRRTLPGTVMLLAAMGWMATARPVGAVEALAESVMAGPQGTLLPSSPATDTSGSPQVAAAYPVGGFDSPVALIPELGLWVDGLTQVGFAKKTGLALWWGLEPSTRGGRTSPALDWRRVTFRIRVEAYSERGKRVASEQALVEPVEFDGASERGGFPTLLKLVLSPGTYRIHLEAYPLISAKAAGLDSVPRGVAEVSAIVPEITQGSLGWRISDLLFFRAVRRWEPGSAPERVWYDWVAYPNVPREFAADTASAHLAFEVLRSADIVPRCAPGRCRVVVTFRDGAGNVVHQELRPVPEAGSVSAYLVPFRPGDLAPGSYEVEIEVYDGQDLQSSMRRGFRVLGPAG